jgi:hypothetical protein
VGDGVICTGPTIPGGGVSGQSVTVNTWIFLPVVGQAQ